MQIYRQQNTNDNSVYAVAVIRFDSKKYECVDGAAVKTAFTVAPDASILVIMDGENQIAVLARHIFSEKHCPRLPLVSNSETVSA